MMLGVGNHPYMKEVEWVMYFCNLLDNDHTKNKPKIKCP
ncbi:hypothetical protein X986_5165 [Burkholderia pseudomallei]|nr:hypothetical protein BG16_1095 [Burkholderia pseudomallei MSHR2543]KGC25865.1 hypothetical protein DO73_593 [Burkholderia pseudomallei]KGW15497.1 hypothetical protein X980_808 [Burkholderia pseudomallei MSHR4000]KGX38017.1 hypothetical protein Y598_2399 [Burkholderia pseudomallei MSHR3335]KGX52642.1 hypothetical protein Y025_1242 [Burkholderia pseudomallei TSV32]